MSRSFIGRGWPLAWGVSSLLACNLILDNDEARLSDAGAPSTSSGGSEPIDATVDGALPPPLDGSSDDAGQQGNCRKIAAPTLPCFEDGSCLTTDLMVQRTLAAGVNLDASPHDLALWGGYLYYSAQDTSTEGRNGYGAGQLFRVATNLTGAPVPVSPPSTVDGLSASVASIRDGFLFWRTYDPQLGKSAIHRLDLSRWSGAEPCTETACGYELVTADRAGRVNELWAVSPTEVYARIDKSLHLFSAQSGVWISGTLPASIEAAEGRLREGFWTGWSPGASASEDGYVNLYSLVAGSAPQARLSWRTPSGLVSPVPFESSLLAASCDDTFLYEQWAEPPLRRVRLDAGLGALPEQMFSPIECSDCRPELTFSHVADARFSYLARPNDEGGLLAIEHASGALRKLVKADVWDVVVDDDAIFFTVVNGHKISRIAKH